MAINKIVESDLKGKKMSQLSERPTDPVRMGGNGLSSRDFRQRQDAYADVIKDKVNELIDALNAVPGIEGSDALADLIMIAEEQSGGDAKTLSSVISDLRRDKLDRYSPYSLEEFPMAYVSDNNGEEMVDNHIPVVDDASSDDPDYTEQYYSRTIVRRTMDGRVKFADGTEASDGVTKEQLDAVNAALSALISALQSAKYEKPGTGIPKTDLAASVQSALDKADTALQPSDATDSATAYKIAKRDPNGILHGATPGASASGDSLVTKEMFDPIKDLAEGAEQAAAASDYSTLVGILSAANKTDYRAGQKFLIGTYGVPDVGVLSVEDTAVSYTYTTDGAFEASLMAGTLQIGYFVLRPVEGKTNLDGYATEEYVNDAIASNVDNNLAEEGKAADAKKVGEALDELNDAVDKITEELTNKANTDGVYSGMSVGHATNADNLTPYSEESGTIQDAPFISQGTGTANNTASVDTSPIAKMLVKQGNTVVKNQLVQDLNTTNWTFEANVTGTITSGEAVFSTTSVGYGLTSVGDIYMTGSHKILVRYFAKAESNCTLITLLYGSGGVNESKSITTNYAEYYQILTIPSGKVKGHAFFYTTSTGVNVYMKGIKLYDLTAHFNGNDNIPQDLLDNPDHWSWYENSDGAYDAGSLANANGRYLVCTGRQLFNTSNENVNRALDSSGTLTINTNCNTTDYILIVPNRPLYHLSPEVDGARYFIGFYDRNKNLISVSTKANGSITAPANAMWVRVTYRKENANGTVLSLYYSPEEGGEGYSEKYPYEEPKVYDTGTEQLLKVGNAVDDKGSNGMVTRRNGSYTFTGSETFYSYGSGYRFEGLYGLTANKYNAFVSDINLPTVPVSSIIADGGDGIHLSTNGFLYLSLTAAQVSGKTLYYELATPTTEQGTTFPDYIDINDYGMMYWLDTDGNLVGIPQGVRLFYPVDYKAFIDTLNSRADGDAGNIVIRTSSGQLFVAEIPTENGHATSKKYVDTKVPDAPSIDGTYSLKVTTVDGVKTYFWVAD